MVFIGCYGTELFSKPLPSCGWKCVPGVALHLSGKRPKSFVNRNYGQQWLDASGYLPLAPTLQLCFSSACSMQQFVTGIARNSLSRNTLSSGSETTNIIRRRCGVSVIFFALSDLLCLLTETCLYRSSFIFNWLDWNNYRKLSQSHICKAFVLWIWCPIVCCSSNTNAQAPCFGLFRVFQSRIF